MSNSHILEERAIKLGMIGTLGMAILGLGFSILTQSEAILLDGLFSLINLMVTFASLRVSRLIRRPDYPSYPSILAAELIGNYHLRQCRLGRLVYAQFYFVISSDQELSLMEQDRLRTILYNALRAEFPYLAADFIFTTDPLWIKRAITPDDRQS